jgi:hypothetical protein
MMEDSLFGDPHTLVLDQIQWPKVQVVFDIGVCVG